MSGTHLSGTTRLYGVLGDPVTQVRAPGMLNPLLAAAGADAVVVPVHATARDLAVVVAGLTAIGNLDGLLVTVPHKAAVCRLAAGLGPAAALSGTANAMRRGPDGTWYAENFDGLGFVRGLEKAGHPVRGRHVVLTGAGGAGSAIAVALLTAGVARLEIGDVDGARLAALLARLRSRWDGAVFPAAPGGLAAADLAVNATPLGMRPGDPLPFDPATVRPDAVVADIIMKPHVTALLRAAESAGRRVHHGVHMLAEQVPCYREFFGWPMESGMP
jgi:shikimate dehydrogenase